jgi:hypothetical protein
MVATKKVLYLIQHLLISLGVGIDALPEAPAILATLNW